MKQQLYTAKQMATILQCHPQTVYRMSERGELKSIKVGNLRRFLMPSEETKQCRQETE